MSDASNASETSGYPSARYAWYMVSLLTIAYVFSYVDRYILGLLVEPIKADMDLSDTQIGLLLGPAFALFYTTMGLPLGWLADRARRTWIIGAGIIVWSLATAASGLARNFAHLFMARVSVGIGEAALSPCALSMISDSFPEEKRGTPIGFYTAALSLGAAIASIAGAAVLTWAGATDQIELPVVGNLKPWQFAFIVVGLPGLLLAVLMLFLKEPARRDRGKITADGNAGFRDAFRYLGSRWRVFLSFVAIPSCMTIMAYSHGWLPATFERTWGWAPEKYALINGIALLVFGPAANNVAGWFSDRLYGRGRRDAPLLIMIAGLFVFVPTQVIGPLMPNGGMALAVFIVHTVGIAVLSATAPTALLNITPGEIRGQVVAIYLMAISITGLLLGPTTVGLLTDFALGEENIRYAMALMPILFGLPVIALVPYARRRYREELDQIQAARADGAPA